MLRTFFWCQYKRVQTQPSLNSYSSGQKRPKGGHIQTVHSSWPGSTPEFCWVPSCWQLGPKTGQKSVLTITKMSLGVFPGHLFMTRICLKRSERPKKLLPKWHYVPARPWSAANKTLLKQFAQSVLRVSNVFSRDFQKKISDFTSPAHLCRSNSTHLSEAKGGLPI